MFRLIFIPVPTCIILPISVLSRPSPNRIKEYTEVVTFEDSMSFSKGDFHRIATSIGLQCLVIRLIYFITQQYKRLREPKYSNRIYS